MDPAIGCLILLGVMALLFITELIPLAVTAMGGAIICGFLNFIPDNVVFSGLSHPTVTLFAGMFVVGAAMFHTGLAHSIGVFIVKRAGKSQKNLMLCIMFNALHYDCGSRIKYVSFQYRHGGMPFARGYGHLRSG